MTKDITETLEVEPRVYCQGQASESTGPWLEYDMGD